MTNNSRLALFAVAVAALCAATPPVRAQVTTAPVIKAAPVRTQEVKPIKTRFLVLRMMSTGIQVQSLVNERELHTFIYSPEIRDQMQTLLDQGGYQYGDKVSIHYLPGSNVALKIKGKPSKPL